MERGRPAADSLSHPFHARRLPPSRPANSWPAVRTLHPVHPRNARQTRLPRDGRRGPGPFGRPGGSLPKLLIERKRWRGERVRRRLGPGLPRLTPRSTYPAARAASPTTMFNPAHGHRPAVVVTRRPGLQMFAASRCRLTQINAAGGRIGSGTTTRNRAGVLQPLARRLRDVHWFEPARTGPRRRFPARPAGRTIRRNGCALRC